MLNDKQLFDKCSFKISVYDSKIMTLSQFSQALQEDREQRVCKNCKQWNESESCKYGYDCCDVGCNDFSPKEGV